MNTAKNVLNYNIGILGWQVILHKLNSYLREYVVMIDSSKFLTFNVVWRCFCIVHTNTL